MLEVGKLQKIARHWLRTPGLGYWDGESMVAIICVFQQKRKHYEIMYLIYIYIKKNIYKKKYIHTYIYTYIYIYMYIYTYYGMGRRWKQMEMTPKACCFCNLASKEYQTYGGRSTRIEGIVWEIFKASKI